MHRSTLLTRTLGATLCATLCLFGSACDSDNSSGKMDESDESKDDDDKDDDESKKSSDDDDEKDEEDDDKDDDDKDDDKDDDSTDEDDEGTSSEEENMNAECDAGKQDCPDGQKCSPYVKDPDSLTVDATKCVPVMDEKGPGEDCTRNADEGNDDCGVGLFCFTGTSGGDGPGYCDAMCDKDLESPCKSQWGLADSHCFNFNEGIFPVCLEGCNPLLQDCENMNKGCYAALDGYLCTAPDIKDGDGSDGSACITVQSCKPGQSCQAPDSLVGCDQENEGCCTPFCDTESEENPCEEAEEECVQALTEPPPGTENVGICLKPTE